jgi:WhiB family transcriptional regulator, redox-sensing transcriptional regulator
MSAPARHRPPVFWPVARPDLSGLPPFDEWVVEAACRGMVDKDEDENDQWHPHSKEAASLGKRFCNGCPVRLICGQWALAYGEKVGTWGGVDQWTRADMISGKS